VRTGRRLAGDRRSWIRLRVVFTCWKSGEEMNRRLKRRGRLLQRHKDIRKDRHSLAHRLDANIAL